MVNADEEIEYKMKVAIVKFVDEIRVMPDSSFRHFILREIDGIIKNAKTKYDKANKAVIEGQGSDCETESDDDADSAATVDDTTTKIGSQTQ